MARTKLTSVEIRGFKSISYNHPVSLTLSDVNILLGANGAGKSNLISFFRMLNYMMSGALQIYVAQSGTSVSALHYGPKITPRLEGHLTFENQNGKDYYDFALTSAVGQRLIFSEETIKWDRINSNEPYIRSLENNFAESGLVDNNDSTARIIRNLLANCKAYQFHDSSANGALRQGSSVRGAQYLQSEGNNLASFLYFLKDNHNTEYQRIVSHIRMILPTFGDFYLEPSNGYINLCWKNNSANDYIFSSDQLSDGSIRFIALATLLLQPEKTMPSVIIIDEPELGLHPFAISQLAEMIRDASLHAQIIISTQSVLLIDEFSANDITVIENVEPDNHTTARHLNEEELNEWLNDYTISQLWIKNVIGGQPL